VRDEVGHRAHARGIVEDQCRVLPGGRHREGGGEDGRDLEFLGGKIADRCTRVVYDRIRTAAGIEQVLLQFKYRTLQSIETEQQLERIIGLHRFPAHFTGSDLGDVAMERKILQSMLLHEGLKDREGRYADTQAPFF
jgi:hypothetical protein